MVKKYFICIGIIMLTLSEQTNAQGIYFPPLAGSAWDTVNPSSLGWCQPAIDTLIQFLGQKHTRAFLVLKDGKIAIEHYYGNFTADSLWYWASAGKSLTGFLTGIAQEEGLLNIHDSTSAYLGAGWTSCPPGDEGMITIRDQLSMTTGLDDINSTNDCFYDSCLTCIAVPGSRWAYHNAPYTLLHQVMANASGVSYNNFTQTRILAKTGMTGFWFLLGFDDIFISKARSMARFGLLMLNNGIWNGDTLLHDTAYFHAMVNTSQNINPSYGYLWWLNGKGSFMIPGLQLSFPGALIPAAPADLFAALGKNDQKIHVVPSMNLVVVRMGDAADTSLAAPTTFDQDLWLRLHDVFCSTSGISAVAGSNSGYVFPVPFTDIVHLDAFEASGISSMELFSSTGSKISSGPFEKELDLRQLGKGLYFLRLLNGKNQQIKMVKLVKAGE